MRVLGFLLSLLAVIQFSFGSFLNNVVIEYDKPTSVRGAEMTTLGGGGIRFRFQDTTYALFNITPPSLKAGCSGIDLGLGALGLLNFEQFGRLFEALMGPAGIMFAFNLALSALCPQCQKILDELGAIANQLNQMQISQCGAVAVAGALGRMVGKAINDKITGGQEDSFNKALQSITSSLQSLRSTLENYLNQFCPGGKCGLAIMLNGGCLMNAVADELRYLSGVFGSVGNFAGVLRYYFGDVCFPQKSGLSGAVGIPTDGVYYPAQGSVKEFVSSVLGFGDGSDGSNACSVISSKVKMVSVEFDSQGRPNFNAPKDLQLNQSICFYAESVVDDIKNRIRNREPLTTDQISLLSSIPVPIYKLLNYGSVYSGFLNAIGDQLRKYIMMELAIAILQRIAGNALTVASSYQAGLTGEREEETNALKDVKEIMKQVAEVSRDLEPTRRQYIKELRDAIHSYEIADKIYTSMFANMAYSPIYGNLVFSRLLGIRF